MQLQLLSSISSAVPNNKLGAGICINVVCGCEQALQATTQRYSAEEVAGRAVPALAPLSVDPVAQVTQPPCYSYKVANPLPRAI